MSIPGPREEAEQKSNNWLIGLIRRKFLAGTIGRAAGAGLLLAVLSSSLPSCLSFVQRSPITIIHPKKYEPPSGISGWRYEGKLADAMMDFVKKYNYPNIKFGEWGAPLKEIDHTLEERIKEIADLAVESCNRYKHVYPVDPAMLMAGMYIESMFYPFAVSDALAVGAAQFINNTANSKKFGMLCAGDIPEHYAAPYKLPELAGSFEEYDRLKVKLSRLERENLEDAAKNGKRKKISPKEREEKERLKQNLRQAIEEAKEGYKRFLMANFEGRDISNDDDKAFLEGFDQRVLYEKAVPAMALYIAENLRALNGDVLTAWVAYNAGLGSTSTRGYMKQYGRISNTTSANYAHTIIQITDELNRMIFGM